MIKLKSLLESSSEDYRGHHTAPNNENGSPLYNVTGVYPDDIYGPNGILYYGGRDPEISDQISMFIIHACRNKPKKLVRIYRAVPNINKEIDSKIKDKGHLIYYIQKFGFPPVGDHLAHERLKKLNFNKDLFIDELSKEIEILTKKKQTPLKINPGDWVTINKQYAISHGKSNLLGNYKILTKSVPAATLFTTGDSIHEWGYNP